MKDAKIYKRVIKAFNESQLERATNAADKAKCKYAVHDFCTKITVSGTRVVMEKFIKIYNAS